MLIPYNVDRPARCIPYVTYGLMGINIFIFLATVFVALVYLPVDRLQAKSAVDTLLAQDRDKVRSKFRQVAKAPASVTDTEIDQYINSMDADDRQQLLALVAIDRADTEDGYKQFWQIAHMESRYVLEPHYSVLNIFAYRPADPSVLSKIVGLLFSMFLHGGVSHLLGNMLYLWVFGRALEDALGPRIYAGSYLLCGVAASLLHHVMTMSFAPSSGAIPSMGASGAIAGVMGLFALRFYRTRVRIFYVLPHAVPMLIIAFVVAFFLLYLLTQSALISALLAMAAAGAGMFVFGRTWAWGAFKTPSAVAIAVWLILFNLVPALREMFDPEKGGGVAYWAHIGGFMFGMLYALLIGSQEEGKAEYLLEDAEKAYQESNIENAVTRAQNLLAREPNNAAAYEVLAKSFDRQKNEDAALDNYELAIQNYLRIGERDNAARTYLLALENHPRFIMPATTQLILGNQMAKNGQYEHAADALVKIPYTFPEAPEGEVSLLRCAQLYLQHLNQPARTLTLLQLFRQRYPESPWMPQAQQAWTLAQTRIQSGETSSSTAT